MSQQLLKTARLAAKAGEEVVLRYFRDDALEIRAKSPHDYVTMADRESETAILEILRDRHPDHRIVAEEGGSGAEGDSSTPLWLVDPLDGTTNFLHGLPIFAVSVGCVVEGRTVAAVVREPRAGNEFHAAKGQGSFWNGEPMQVTGRPGLDGAFMATGYPFRARAAVDVYLGLFRSIFLRAKALRRMGAAALDLAYTAAGVYDGFFEFRLSPWDIAAGALLIEEAGGVVSDLDGGAGYLESGNVLAGTPGVHRDLLSEVAGVTSEDDLESIVPLDSL